MNELSKVKDSMPHLTSETTVADIVYLLYDTLPSKQGLPIDDEKRLTFVFALWEVALKEYSIKQIWEGAVKAIKVGTWVPTPADVIKCIEGSHEGDSLLAYEEILTALSAGGAFIVFENPITQTVIDRLGGWERVKRRIQEWDFKKTFQALYNHSQDNLPTTITFSNIRGGKYEKIYGIRLIMDATADFKGFTYSSLHLREEESLKKSLNRNYEDPLCTPLKLEHQNIETSPFNVKASALTQNLKQPCMIPS